MPDVNLNSRAQLEESLKLWKARLAKEKVQLSTAQKARAAIAKQVQIAESIIQRREGQLRQATAGSGARTSVLRAALSFVGTTENPPGSNTGRLVDQWERLWGIHAEPWCGAFAGAMLTKGGCHMTPRIVFTPYIFDDAVAGHNGLSKVIWRRGEPIRQHAHTCDLVLYDFGGPTIEHVGLLRAPWRGGQVFTVEGNTSFSNGSQSNGGCVALKQRDLSLVHSIVQARWP